MTLQRGDFVEVRLHDQRFRAMVTLASENGRSLMIMFDGAARLSNGGLLLGMMALLQDEGGDRYTSLVGGDPVVLTRENQ